MSLVGLLVTILVLVLIGGVLWWVVSLIPLPAPFGTVVQVVLGLIFVLVLLGVIFGGISVPLVGVR